MFQPRGLGRFCFSLLRTTTTKWSGHKSRKTGTEVCICLKPSGYRAAHGSPHTSATFPHTPLHRRVLIHLGVLQIFPGKLLFGAELLIGLVLLGSTDVCLI